MTFNVMTVADYGSAYEGSFMRSLSALETAIASQGGLFIYVLPQRAMQREWAQRIAAKGNVFFFSGGVLSKAKLLRKLIKKYKINIIHSHFATSSTYIPIFLVSFGKNIFHAAHIHGEVPSGGGKIRKLIKRHLRRADVNICAGQALCESAAKADIGSCVLVTNAVDFTRLDSFERLSKQDFGVPSSSLTVLSFGYDFAIKGVDTALDALSKFDKDSRYVLLLCPAAHVSEAREQIIAKFGSMPPFVRLLEPRDDIASYYHLADIFLAASRKEGFSFAAVEAAYCKKPLALSDISAHRQRNIPGTVFFEPGNPQALFDALLKAEKQLGGDFSHGQQCVIKEYSIDRWVSEIVNIYSDLYKPIERRR